MGVQCDEPSNHGASYTHHEPVKWLSKKTCVKCNERGGVLVCSNVSCPIVVHKHCLACIAYFDDRGNFYCPYCEYKQAFDECQKARERAILAKKTLAAFLDTKSVSSTGNDPTVECSEKEIPERSDSTFQSGLVMNSEVPKKVMNSEVPKKAAENGEIHSGRVGETAIGEQSLKEDVHIVRDHVTPAKQKFSEMENLKTKCNEIAMPSEANSCRGIKGKQAQREPHGMFEKDLGREQLKVNLENGRPSPKLPKDHCDKGKSLIRSPTNASGHKRNHDASLAPKESGSVSRNDEESKDTEEVSYEETEEQEQQVDTSIYLTREDDSTVVNDTPVKGDVAKFHAAVNSENVVFGERQHNKIAMDASGLANQAHKQTECREPTKENVEKVNNGVHDENLPRNHEAVNKNNTDQNSNIGDFHFIQEERRKHVRLPKIDGISMSKENKDVSHEELDTEDESKSSQEIHHTGYRPRSKRKRQKCRQSESGNQCLKEDAHIMRGNVTPALKMSKMENLKTKRHESSMPLEANCNRGMKRKQTQGEPHGMIEKNEGSEQLTVNSEDGGSSAEVPKDDSDNAKTSIQSPKNAAYRTRKHDASVTPNENTPRNYESVNKNKTDQNSDIRDFHFKEDEGGRSVKLRKIDDIYGSKENTAVSNEELDTEDESKSSQENHHTKYRLRSKWKCRISEQPEIDSQSINSASFSDSDFEECEEEVTPVKSRQKVDSSKQNVRTPISIGRRKKLPWTKEEEDTLKEGVDKFSLTTKKNTPWLKILEFGSHVFDGTRTPDDLKDKWRRILSKAHENA